MSTDSHRDRVDQILYWWTPDNTHGRGVGPVRNSVQTDQRFTAYVEGLADFVRMSDAGPTRRPPWSLTYVRFNAWAAAIRRTRVADDNRHDIGHALVGHPDKITPSLVLALSDWPEWRVAEDLDCPVSPLSGSHLRQECRRRRPSLDAIGPDAAAPASILLAHRLAEPDAQFGVVTPPDVTPEAIVATLWTVHQTLAAVLHEADEFDIRNETFTTYAPGLHDGTDDRLRTVCAPTVGSTGSFGVSRQVVHPWQAGGQPPREVIAPEDAAALVELYARLGPDGFGAELQAAGHYRSGDTRSRIRQLPGTIVRMRDALDAGQRAVQPRPSQPVTQPRPSQAVTQPLPHQSGDLLSGPHLDLMGPSRPAHKQTLRNSARPAPRPFSSTMDESAAPAPEPVGEPSTTAFDSAAASGSAAAFDRSGSHPADDHYHYHQPPAAGRLPQESRSQPYTSRSDLPATPVELIRRVIRVPPGDLEQWLAWNLPAGTDFGPDDRSAVRAELVNAGFHAALLFDRLPADLARTVVTRLVEVAIGPDLATSDPRTWEFLRSPGLSPVVVRAICDHACDRGLPAPLLPWLGLRYLDQAGHHVPPDSPVWPAAPAAPKRWWLRLRTWPRVRRTALIRVGWLVNALTAGVLIGLLLAIMLVDS
ncbi:hypothetical protein O7632_22605 [Solwaraspora sp. WMMD406]|uniref:hypothetical protein n=1 Tax=Solwaraspora sp. WMMD406 TaxID=3016095 RepID=UPI002415B8A0|nr:hypothetical protein [Solwaraspora sp. WMMD406]MDG4766868.1 hypothetical protein [Solwaraspora sp. WMMD406]